MLKRKRWSVYILKCANGAFYTGITNDLARRLAAHSSGRGARYTRSFGPVKLVWQCRCAGRSGALKREAAIKKLPRARKAALVRETVQL